MALIFRVALDGTLNNVDVTRNVFTLESPSSLPADSAIASYLNSIWHSGLKAYISSLWTTTRFIVEEPDGLGHWQYNHEATITITGTGSGDMLPQQVAGVLVGITASRRRGKKFIAGLLETANIGGILQGTSWEAMNTAAAAYVAGFEDTGVTIQAGVCKPDGTSFLEFSGYRVDRVLGTQRRRKQGVGQ